MKVPRRPCSSEDAFASVSPVLRAASKIHVAPVDAGPRFLLRAIARRQLQTSMFALSDGHHDWHLRCPIFGQTRRDVHELKQFETVDAALTLRDPTELVEVSLIERELAADDLFIDGHIAFDGDRSKHRLRSRVSYDRELHARLASFPAAQRLGLCRTGIRGREARRRPYRARRG